MFALITTSLELQATPPFSQSTTLNISRALTFDLVIAMGGTATSSQKGLYWTRRSYYKLLKCRVLLVVVVAAIAAQEEH
jgi:hypothetical protein